MATFHHDFSQKKPLFLKYRFPSTIQKENEGMICCVKNNIYLPYYNLVVYKMDGLIRNFDCILEYHC